jgi:acetoacetyl-[acyl-carrier protein] synthase
MDAMIINSKGFGGNNASASILAPHIVKSMLTRKYGEKALAEYSERNASVAAQTEQNDQEITLGLRQPIYLFDNNVLDGNDLEMTDQSIAVKGYQYKVSLDLPNPYE